MSMDAPVQYPYRHLLREEERLELSRPDTPRVLRDIGLLWAQILLAWAGAWYLGSAWAIALAMLVVGNRYYALYIIGHDGLHRRLHGDVRINDLINDGLILAPIGAITRVNRLNHMQHHRTLGRPGDPDLFKYRSREKLSAGALLLSFTGLPLVLRAAGNVFGPGKTAAAAVARPKHSRRDLAILGLWQLALIGGLTLAFGWWGYPLLWLLPVAMLTVAFDLLRVFSEHSVENETAGTTLAERMVMVESSFPERLLFSPMNMNHHVAHHLWPTIPYYHLPRATALLEARALDTGTPIVRRRGYCRYLLACLARAAGSRFTPAP
ncbi:hypothetical protein D0B54_18900 [Solimonas sp. K1W22B-7]|uniref:fatty acid desaturase family protein n=1 Tax=Solimonas sp. K1W22B-7 TaxID=2303331 RepID=UPI000E33210A|nr:fatty acid desaturase [Solimonas sp. K1W22B-7]AXQ30622.1 hypothetical protein D0B54_18900 [Solimonas sp. K1W22B-7]